MRQPLAKARINVGTQTARENLQELADVLMEEINVKEIEVVSDVGDLVNYKILPNNRALGPKYGKRFGAVRKALSALNPADVAAQLQENGELTLSVAGEDVVLSADEVIVQTEAKGDDAVASERGVTVAVDTVITPELEQEGYARDLVRNLNNARKDAGFEISDRVHVVYSVDGSVGEAFENFADFIAQEVLAESLTAGTGGDFTTTVSVGGQEVALGLTKA